MDFDIQSGSADRRAMSSSTVDGGSFCLSMGKATAARCSPNEATENPRRPDNEAREARRATGYAINGLGERITKSGVRVQPNGEIVYVYDGAGHLLGEYDANGQAIEE